MTIVSDENAENYRRIRKVNRRVFFGGVQRRQQSCGEVLPWCSRLSELVEMNYVRTQEANLPCKGDGLKEWLRSGFSLNNLLAVSL